MIRIHRLHCVLFLVCCLSARAAIGQSAMTSLPLISPSKGQIPNDTGSDGKTKMTIVKLTELGGDALKVVFAPGDSFGDRDSRVKNWKPFSRVKFTIHNPGEATTLEFNVNHKRTFNYQTRAVHQIKLETGRNPVSIDLDRLVNVNGSSPDLANVLKWYVNCEEGKSPTLYFSDLVLEAGAAAVPVATPAGTTPPPKSRFRVRGTIGDAKVDLIVEPLDDSVAGQESRPVKVAGDPARIARIRAAKMPKVDKVIAFDTPEADAILSALELFPPDNPWNLLVSDWPLHPNSQAMVASIGSDKVLRVNDDMCFVIVPPQQPKVDVKLVSYPDESDPGPFPVPDSLPIEGWPKWHSRDGKPLTLAELQQRPAQYEGDRHAIVLDPVGGKLYEFFVMGRIGSGWAADQSSVFDLKSNRLRPDTWTSADAAGLPIFPAVIRYDELQRGEIEHAMRFTIRRSRKSYVYPATHHAGHGSDEDLPRMGERFRLRQDFDLKGFSPTVQTILKGLKKYGMFVADNGLEWSLSMAPDPRIPDIHEELRKVKGADFEVVQPPEGYRPPVE
ncbi:MAG: hypothetical protein JSS49_07580 [Planctomycetes bacterium]|nr:hypothetical protein [Planctomycetota bacterium]